MLDITNQKLLKNKKAVEEINRHRWIESEKAGCDIGFETASVDWLEKFSGAWMQYHMPKRTPKRKAQSYIAKPAKSKRAPSSKAAKKTKIRSKTK